VSGDTSGVRWPLALFFLFTLCGGAIGLVAPSWLGNGRMIPSLLILAALFAGGALYFPHFWLAIKVPDIGTISAHVDEIRTALRGPTGDQDKLQTIIDAINRLSDNVYALNTRFNPGGDVRIDIQAIKTLLESGTVHTNLNTIAAALADGGDLRKALDTIKTQVSAGGDLRAKIDDIAAKLPKTP
jgi:hypothetical protein